MIAEFRLPDLGEGLPEAEIVQWLVSPGDAVALNQPIAEVETAKAIVELPSPFAGTVAALHAAAGDVVAVGAPVIAIETGAPERAPEPSAHDAEERPAPNLVGYGAAPRAAGRPQRRPRTHGAAAGLDTAAALDTAVRAAAPHDAVAAHVADEAPHERPRSTPPVRARARDLGVDLELVTASDPSGVITRADVDAYVARRAEAPPDDRVTRIPVRGVRRHTADAMVRSAFTAPHATTFLEVDVTATTELVARLRADPRAAPHRIGVLAVVARAVCLALSRHPDLNARWDEEAGVIEQYRFVNLGIAAATERGLVVPNVKDAGRLGLAELADAIAGLVDEARGGRPAFETLSGGTFSITNYGVFGVDAGTPILNPGEAGILGIGAVRRRPWEHDGGIALRDVLALSLSFDHRVVDGEQASRFLVEVGALLREPARALLFGG